MTKAEFLAILEKNLDGTASEAERKILDDFFRHQLANSRHEWTFTERERIRIEVFESLNRAIDEDALQQPQHRPGVWRVAVAAAVLIAAAVGLYLFQLAPEEIRYTTIVAQRGEQRTVTLGDGSVVRLNAESSITFPDPFTIPASRDIQLTGEAFFDVARDEARPFVVRSADLVTTVLGTSFNIRAYPEDETVTVTVASGTVRIGPGTDTKQNTGSELLGAGEQGLYHKRSARIARTEVDVERYLAWKDGTILLEGASLQEATDILARWYNAEFIFRNPETNRCTIDGKFRNDQLENILENLRFLVGLEYRIEPGNRVIIDGQTCH